MYCKKPSLLCSFFFFGHILPFGIRHRVFPFSFYLGRVYHVTVAESLGRSVGAKTVTPKPPFGKYKTALRLDVRQLRLYYLIQPMADT